MATTRRKYTEDFDPHVFINEVVLKYPKFRESIYTSFHRAFEVSKSKRKISSDVKGRRLLDIGTGPSPHSVISASAFVDSIYLSDIAPQNLTYLSEWQQGKNDYSLKPFFEIDVGAEGNGESVDDLERSLREKVSGILKIDILKNDPLAPYRFPEFDIITSCLCFEAAAETIDDYKTIASNVKKLLKNGGYLVLYGYLENAKYQVGDKEFPDLSITYDQVIEIWKGVGMEIVFFEDVRGKFRHNFIMVAKLVKEESQK